MLIKAQTLKGYKLEGLDGEIGKVREFYFDDHHWAVRYLVADTGNWLTGRQVLISPYALLGVTPDQRRLAVKLTKKQIEDSPSLDSDKPVSRQFEGAFHGYYAWPTYWSGPYMWGAYSFPYTSNPYASTAYVGSQGVGDHSHNSPPAEDAWDPHLRSTHDVRNHRIQATDGEIGHVEDFIVDDETWAIRYLVVDTRNWWPGKKVLISPRWIDRISWGESKVFVNLSRQTVKEAPEYAEGTPLTRDYETRLHHHYDRQGYWVDEPAAKQHSH